VHALQNISRSINDQQRVSSLGQKRICHGNKGLVLAPGQPQDRPQARNSHTRAASGSIQAPMANIASSRPLHCDTLTALFPQISLQAFRRQESVPSRRLKSRRCYGMACVYRLIRSTGGNCFSIYYIMDANVLIWLGRQVHVLLFSLPITHQDNLRFYPHFLNSQTS